MSCIMYLFYYLSRYAVMRKQLYPLDKNLKDLFLESVHNYPYNWSAWIELGECITNRDMVSTFFLKNFPFYFEYVITYLTILCPSKLGNLLSRLPNTFMSLFFKLHMSAELQDFPQA